MEEIVNEYPKMLYKHPADESQEHSFITVNNEDEELEAGDKGYQTDPHVPVVKEDNGIKVEQPTSDPSIISEKADSPKDILEDQHMNDKPDGEKIEE